MADFSHLDKFSLIGNETINFDISDIMQDAYLTIRPATSDNIKFKNELIKAGLSDTKKNNRRIMSDDSKADEEMWISIASKSVVVGWSNVFDSEGNAVEFSPANCEDLLKSLPSGIFINLVQLASDPKEFKEHIDPLELDDFKKN